MPLYEFQCEACGCCFEKLVFQSDKDTVVCPGCDGKQVKRVMSRVFCCSQSKGVDASSGAGGSGFS